MITNASYLTRKPPNGWKWWLYCARDNNTLVPVIRRGTRAYIIWSENELIDMRGSEFNHWDLASYQTAQFHPVTKLIKVIYAGII